MDDDRLLVDRARRGDAEAFGELVERHQHRVVSYVRALVSDAADAEDVAQEAFLRAYRALRQFRGQSSFKTWLYQIATNVARTHLDKRRTRREDQPDETGESGKALSELPSGEDVESDVIRRDQIDRALAVLPAEQREIVVLRDVEGLEYREIAEALAIPIGTVESRLFRARQKLRHGHSARGPREDSESRLRQGYGGVAEASAEAPSSAGARASGGGAPLAVIKEDEQ